MEDLVEKIVIGCGVVVGVGLAMARRRAQNRELAPRIERILRERGPQTLPELGSALGMGGLLARGKVVLALNALTAAGNMEIIAAPPGTPQLEKVNHIRYQWREA